MRVSQRLFFSVATTLLVFAASANAVGARDESNLPRMESEFPVAEVHFLRDALSWDMVTEYQKATLAVSGPEGIVFKTDFGQSEMPRFDLDSVEYLPDGHYHWELNLAARQFSGEGEYLEPFRMTGQFKVEFSQILPVLDERGTQASVAVPSNPDVSYVYDVSGDWTITGWLGVGAEVPVNPIHIIQTVPTIQFSDSDYATPDPINWYINGEDNGFDISTGNNDYSERIFYIAPGAPQPSFWMDAVGNIGAGTSTPSAPLHVLRTDGTAKFIVEETSATTAARFLFQLINNGGSRFSFKNSNSLKEWFFSMDGSSDFNISLVGTGGPELLMRKDGTILMGPGASTVFNLSPTGNLEIGGALTEFSDRNAKKNIQAVDGQQVLEKLVQLPLAEWTYKTDEDGVRHLSPMAQDFRAAFGLGQDERHLATLDTSGVALAAIKGLNEIVQSQREEIETLKTDLAEMRQMLSQR